MITVAEPETPDHAERIALIANVVRDAYGDEAVTVAERQVDAADEHSRGDWVAILDYLRNAAG